MRVSLAKVGVSWCKRQPCAGYVGLSRVVKGSGLYLFPGIEISSDLLYQHDKYAEAEIERLLSSEM